MDRPKAGDENSDNEVDDPDRSKPRYQQDEHYQPELFEPLTQTPRGAKEWDGQLRERMPELPTVPRGSISPPTAGTALQLDGGTDNQFAVDSPGSM